MRNDQHVLLFGDDGSQASDAAWLWINNHTWSGWALDRLTASTVTVKALGPVRDVPRLERTPFTEAGFSAVQSSFVDGDPRVVLSEVADADLLVVGSHGRSNWRGTWVGSTTTWLMQDPTAPLVMIRHGRRTQRVLVAVDGSVHADAAVQALVELPWASTLEVLVVSVDDGRTDAAASLKAGAMRLEGSVATLATQELSGHATDALVEAIENSAPDLVVMGTRGLTGWSRLTVGSTATAVVHSSGCNALLACGPAADSA